MRPDDKMLVITSMAVPKELRRTKSAHQALKQMQKDIEQVAIGEGAQKVVLFVEPKDKMLIKMYRKFVFCEMKNPRHYFYDSGEVGYYNMEIVVDKYLASKSNSK